MEKNQKFNEIIEYEEGKYYVKEFISINKNYVYVSIKRLFDFFSSLIAIIILLIPMIIIAIAIKLDSKGPVFYKQERLGLNGKKFKVIKFRSMRIDAEKNGPQWAEKEDDRITKFGKFIRKTRLDEIPQFFNVLVGDMSLIGPRPEREFFYNEFSKYISGFDKRLLIKPGITGLAQVNGGYESLPEEKIVYDIYYIENRNIFMDLKIIFDTIRVVFTNDGAR